MPNGWHLLEIEPITYPQSSENDHSTLYEGIRRLAELIHGERLIGTGKLPQLRKILRPCDEETEDLMKYALTDTTRTRFFTDAATAPEWIDWLDKCGYLNRSV